MILVSKDVLVRVKADAIGLRAEDFLSDRVVEFNSIYTGFSEVYIAKELLSQFYEKGELLTSQIANHSFFANQFLVMKDAFGGSGSAIGIVEERFGLSIQSTVR